MQVNQLDKWARFLASLKNVAAVKLVLSGVVFFTSIVVFLPVIHNDFISLDDHNYVFNNQHVKDGLTLDGIKWSLVTLHGGISYWHPLTWMSLMLDYSIFGSNVAAMHATSMLLHSFAAMAIFGLFYELTGSLCKSLLIAGVFAVHPTRIESVAWVTERKDVLVAFFGFFSLWAYVAHIKRQAHTKIISWAAFICAVMAKPPVAAPMAALAVLLHIWVKPKDGLKCIALGVWPILGAATAGAVVVLIAASEVGAMAKLDDFPLVFRFLVFGNQLLFYLRDFVYPQCLCVMYPYPSVAEISALWSVVGLTVGGVIIWMAVRLWSNPVALGLAWFIVTLAPLSGIIQVGPQCRADRFTYVPYIGLAFAALVLIKAKTLYVIVMVWIAWLGHETQKQIPTWKNGLTAWTQAVKCNDGTMANIGLATTYLKDQQDEKAEKILKKVISKNSNVSAIEYLADVYMMRGKYRSALIVIWWAESYGRSRFPTILTRKGECLYQLGHHVSAAKVLKKALIFDNKNVVAIRRLAWISATSDVASNCHLAIKLGEKLRSIKGLDLDPLDLKVLASCYACNGQFKEAADQIMQGQNSDLNQLDSEILSDLEVYHEKQRVVTKSVKMKLPK
jgi:hypothetical protein